MGSRASKDVENLVPKSWYHVEVKAMPNAINSQITAQYPKRFGYLPMAENRMDAMMSSLC